MVFRFCISFFPFWSCGFGGRIVGGVDSLKGGGMFTRGLRGFVSLGDVSEGGLYVSLGFGCSAISR